jgi:hypothetical protein
LIVSSDLSVKLTRAVPFAELIPQAELALGEILAVPEAAVLRVEEVEKGVTRPVTRGAIDSHGPMLLIGIEGGEEVVGVTVCDLPELYPHMPEEEAGPWASIAVGATRTPLEFALAASVAIALARLLNTKIVDDGAVWSLTREREPGEFTRALSVRGRFADIRGAAESLRAAMPVG